MIMRRFLTEKFIRMAVANKSWDIGNKVLYDMCAKYPAHETAEVIIAKIWLIGRSYSAAIERRRTSKPKRDGDRFYEKKVAGKIRRSDIDAWFQTLRANGSTDVALKIHRDVTDLFERISKLRKRSLASKYLHFHFPSRFYIFDSRAQSALRRVITRREKIKKSSKHDFTYAKFFGDCETLRVEIRFRYGLELEPRDLDKVLLAVSAKIKK